MARGKACARLAGEPRQGGKPAIDRFHNNEALSPEALARGLDEVRAGLAELAGRLDAMGGELETQIGDTGAAAREDTRRLALSVAQMGEALSRRIAEPSLFVPPRPPPPRMAGHPAIWIVAAMLVIAALSGAAWLSLLRAPY